MISHTHAGLLERFILSRDAEAFRCITRQYAGMVYGTCIRITGNQERAADATQETFFHLAKHAREVNGSLAGWLHCVAVGKSVNLVRSEVARRRREQEYAARPRETDDWSEISPLVDEALRELEEEPNEILVRHYLQGETLAEIASEKGLSQPTMSRRAEQALEQLRGRLRIKGVFVAAAVLGSLMPNSASAAPEVVLAELGKMAMAGSGCLAAGAGAGTTVSALKMTLAISAAVAVIGTGMWGAWRAVDARRRASAGATSTSAGQPMTGRTMAIMVRDAGPPSMTTPRIALTLFCASLAGGASTQMTNCFVGPAEVESFRRLWSNPQNEREVNLQTALRSIIPPIEVLETNSTAAGLAFRWTARVRQQFTQVENGVAKNWQPGDRFELRTVLKQVGNEWKIVEL